MRVAPDQTLTCPRCGYDLRGAIASWERDGECPLTGICSECGLSYLWSDVFDPARETPTWCVEFVPRRRIVIASVATFAMSFLPWKFWSRLTVSHALHFRRLLVYVAIVASSVYIAFAAGQVVAALDVRRDLSVCWPTGLAPRMVTYTTDVSAFEAALRAALFPWSDTSPGTVDYGGGQIVSYPTPRDTLKRTYHGGYLGWWHPQESVLKSTTFSITMSIGCVAAFAMFPLTRRLARVRWRHILRIWFYSLAFLVLPMWWHIADAVLILSGAAVRGTRQLSIFERYEIAIAVPLIWGLWWAVAASKYLRLHNGYLVGVVACGIAWLAAFLMIVYAQLL
jgi:hypothetical protein